MLKSHANPFKKHIYNTYQRSRGKRYRPDRSQCMAENNSTHLSSAIAAMTIATATAAAGAGGTTTGSSAQCTPLEQEILDQYSRLVTNLDRVCFSLLLSSLNIPSKRKPADVGFPFSPAFPTVWGQEGGKGMI